MCCILCEEPVRSITLGLAAVGIVTLLNGARKMIQARRSAAEPSALAAPAELPARFATDPAP